MLNPPRAPPGARGAAAAPVPTPKRPDRGAAKGKPRSAAGPGRRSGPPAAPAAAAARGAAGPGAAGPGGVGSRPRETGAAGGAAAAARPAPRHGEALSLTHI